MADGKRRNYQFDSGSDDNLITSCDDFLDTNLTADEEGNDPEADLEVLIVHRLPGETLGMEIDIKRSLGFDSPILGVFVSKVIPGGAADNASGAGKGIGIGDEILQINGTHLHDVTHNEAIQIFNEMPLRVTLMVKRAKKMNTPVSEPVQKHSLSDIRAQRQVSQYSFDSMPSEDDGDELDSMTSDETNDDGAGYLSGPQMQSSYALQTCKTSFLHEGYELRKLVFRKSVMERLGLQIEPSGIGSHRYYQVSVDSSKI